MKRPEGRRLTGTQWHHMRLRYEAGEIASALAREHGVTQQAVSQRIKNEGWNKDANRVASLPPELSQVSGQTESQLKNLAKANSPATPALKTLQSLAANLPEEYQSALALFSQAQITEGIQDIPPPRTIGELEKWINIWRRAAGLDKDKSVGSGGLINPIRTVSRRGESADPLEGFEV